MEKVYTNVELRENFYEENNNHLEKIILSSSLKYLD